MRTRGKVALLGSLYLAQGLPFGFFTQAVPAILRTRGVSLPKIGLTSLLALPWALKFVWAPWVDRPLVAHLGRRRSWILPLQAMSALVILGLALADRRQHGILWLLTGTFLTNLIAATQDIATDGLATDMLSLAERGVGNGVQVAGYRVGMILGGGALLWAFGWLGWELTFVSMSALLALASLPILLHRESSAQDDAVASAASLGQSIKGYLAQQGATRWLTLVALYKSGDVLASAMAKPLLIDIGYQPADLGPILGGAGFVAGLVGALAGGAGVGRLGRRRALLWFGVFQALGAAAYAWPALANARGASTWIVVSVDHLAGGMATAALFTLMMDACRPQSTGFDYTLQASLVVAATGMGAAISGFVAKGVGYPLLFGLSGMLTLFVTVLTYRRLGISGFPGQLDQALELEEGDIG